MAEAAQLSPEEQPTQSTHYLTGEDKDDWENLLEFEAMPLNWNMFKEALFRNYPNTRKHFISSADLVIFVEEKSKQEIHTLDEYANVHREFRRLTTQLAKEKIFSANGLNRVYKRSIHPDLWDKILFYLSNEKNPLHQGRGICS